MNELHRAYRHYSSNKALSTWVRDKPTIVFAALLTLHKFVPNPISSLFYRQHHFVQIATAPTTLALTYMVCTIPRIHSEAERKDRQALEEWTQAISTWNQRRWSQEVDIEGEDAERLRVTLWKTIYDRGRMTLDQWADIAAESWKEEWGLPQLTGSDILGYLVPGVTLHIQPDSAAKLKAHYPMENETQDPKIARIFIEFVEGVPADRTQAFEEWRAGDERSNPRQFIPQGSVLHYVTDQDLNEAVLNISKQNG